MEEKAMRNPTDDELRGLLNDMLTAGFNRSIGALENAGVLDTKKMRREYKGVGSKNYDIVTEQLEKTAKYGVVAIRQLLDKPETPQP